MPHGRLPRPAGAAYNVRMMNLPDTADIRDACAAEPEHLSVFGVDYAHLRLHDGGDLYLTEWGRPFASQLLPQSHLADKEWFVRREAVRALTAVASTDKEVVAKLRDRVANDEEWTVRKEAFDALGEKDRAGLTVRPY